MYNGLTWSTPGTVILSRELRIKDKKQLVLVGIQITCHFAQNASHQGWVCS